MLKLLGILTFTILVFNGCVGTIETKKEKLTSGSVSGTEVLDYRGIENAIPTSHDKVEVTFPMMEGDSNGSITYVVKYNSLNSPKYYKAQDLLNSKDERGNFRVIIDDLALDYYYTFTVQVVDSNMNSSANIKVAEAKTFSNRTSHFYGVSSLQNLTGIDGAYGIKVNWLAGGKTGTLEPDPTDVFKYQIKIIEEPLNPSAFDDPNVDQNLVKEKIVDSNVISIDVNGLKPDTNYYVRVRAIHHDFKNHEQNIHYKKDSNNIFKKIRTFSITDPVNISPASLTAVTSAISGTVNVGWAKAQGPFREYRLYYGKKDVGTKTWAQYSNPLGPVCSNLFDADGWGCKILGADKVSSSISDLENYEVYQIALVACITTSCNQNEKYLEVEVTPDPIMANFLGLASIDHPRAYYQLDTVYLKFSSPDFSSGVISGLFIKFMGRTTQNPIEPACILNHPTDSCVHSSKYSNSPFDFSTETEVAVSGINPYSDDPYCFKVIPYIASSDGIQMANEELFPERCIVPKVDLPTISQFKGIDSVIVDTNLVKIEWTPPIGGIFSKYHLFVFRGGDDFNYNDAISGNEDYVHIVVDYGAPLQPNGRIAYSFGPLLDMNVGEKLKFGIVLSKESETGEEYSVVTPVKEITWL